MRSSTRQMCLMEAQQGCSLLEWLLGRRAHLPINWHIQAHTTFSPRQKSEALSVPSVWLCFAFFLGGIMGCKTWEWRFQSPRLPPHICQGHPKQCIEKTKVLRSLSSGMWDLKRKSHKTGLSCALLAGTQWRICMYQYNRWKIICKKLVEQQVLIMRYFSLPWTSGVKVREHLFKGAYAAALLLYQGSGSAMATQKKPYFLLGFNSPFALLFSLHLKVNLRKRTVRGKPL